MTWRLLDSAGHEIGPKTSTALILVRFMGDVVSYWSQRAVGAKVKLSPDHRRTRVTVRDVSS